MKEQIDTILRLKAKNSLPQPRLSEQRYHPVPVHVFVDKTKWDYCAVAICIAVLL